MINKIVFYVGGCSGMRFACLLRNVLLYNVFCTDGVRNARRYTLLSMLTEVKYVLKCCKSAMVCCIFAIRKMN